MGDQQDERLANRLAAVELRLRLIEDGEPGGPQASLDEDALGLLRPRAESPAPVVLGSADPFDECSMARSQWAADALQVLTEDLARSRARIGQTERELRSMSTTLTAELALERSRADRLEAALAHVYGQAQMLQGVVSAIRSSRSYRVGNRLARLAGHPGPAVSRYETPIADGVDPADVAVVLASGVFDSDWYLATYPDVAAVQADPLAHFMTQARTEHRCPGPLFDTGWYLRAYEGEVPETSNPLAYYLTTGWRLGHQPWETFDPEDYLRAHPELVDLDICPLVHRAATSG